MGKMYVDENGEEVFDHEMESEDGAMGIANDGRIVTVEDDGLDDDFDDDDEENEDLGEGTEEDDELEDKLDDGIEENLSALELDDEDMNDSSFDCD